MRLDPPPVIPAGVGDRVVATVKGWLVEIDDGGASFQIETDEPGPVLNMPAWAVRQLTGEDANEKEAARMRHKLRLRRQHRDFKQQLVSPKDQRDAKASSTAASCAAKRPARGMASPNCASEAPT